jgi:tRNA/rRNA methyltransferase
MFAQSVSTARGEFYNLLLLSSDQRDRLEVVLVSPRNPLNIGAVARAMANFGFEHLTVTAPYGPHWREAKSAVGAPELLQHAREAQSPAEAVAGCTFVAGTGTLTYRKPEQRVVDLAGVGPMMEAELRRGGRVALVFGPEKHGLTREDLSWCHVLVEIPTDPRQPSMNLGQAAAVCLYELGGRAATAAKTATAEAIDAMQTPATSAMLDRLGELIEQTMVAADYSPVAMRTANRHDLRLLLRRLSPDAQDTRRMLGLFRRILWRLARDARQGDAGQ